MNHPTSMLQLFRVYCTVPNAAVKPALAHDRGADSSQEVGAREAGPTSSQSIGNIRKVELQVLESYIPTVEARKLKLKSDCPTSSRRNTSLNHPTFIHIPTFWSLWHGVDSRVER